jgi:serine/threonine-protein kinase
VALAPGTRLGAYEILSLLGQGGMGEVYRARDARLGRDVAIKVLPSDVTADRDRLARFEREAQVLASLNHPNIAHIHGIDDSAGTPALIIELVDGPTLADRIVRGPIPLDEALLIARQIAEALEAAHQKGVVHRDLKPANIKVTPQGTVKVLDFGLAKAFGEEASDSISASLSPTVAGATAAGVILGTAAYMSPEQARGKPVDAQTDIWAFGCVLFEMLSGRQAFAGETITDALASIVRAEPEWSALPAAVPAAIRTLLRHCLQKDPERRLHHIGDARFAIEDARFEPAGSATPSVAAPSSQMWRRALPWAIALAAALVAAITLTATRQRLGPPSPVTRLELNLPPDVELYSAAGAPIAISPDGTYLAFSGSTAGPRSTYVRRLDGTDMKTAPGADLSNSLFFSPESSALGIAGSDGLLKKLSLKDGLIATLARGVDYNSGGTFAPDGRILMIRNHAVWELPVTGGEGKQLARLDADRQEVTQQWPMFLPGGRAVLFTSYAAKNWDAPRIDAVTLADGKRRTLVERAAFPIYTPTGHLVFLRDGAMLAAAFDEARLEVTGPAVRIVENVAVTGSGAPMAAVSATGTLVYASAAATAGRLLWVTRQGTETMISDVPRTFTAPRLSPDGRRIVVAGDSSALWLQDTTRQVFTRLTPPETDTGFPIWAPDGQRVFYRSATGIHWIHTDGSGRGGTVAGATPQDFPGSVSPDGRTLAVVRISPETLGDIYLLSLDGTPQPHALVNTAAYEGGPQFSPDGHWMAYASNESGQFQVYVRPFPAPDRKIQVSTDGGSYPLWNRNGKELFYRNGNKMLAVDIATASMNVDPVLSTPKLLFEQRYAFFSATVPSHDVSADGQRFVMVKSDASANRLNVVINWFEELKRRVPTK